MYINFIVKNIWWWCVNCRYCTWQSSCTRRVLHLVSVSAPCQSHDIFRKWSFTAVITYSSLRATFMNVKKINSCHVLYVFSVFDKLFERYYIYGLIRFNTYFVFLLNLNVMLCRGVVTGLNKWIGVFSVGVVCTFYTTVVSSFSTYIFTLLGLMLLWRNKLWDTH